MMLFFGGIMWTINNFFDPWTLSVPGSSWLALIFFVFAIIFGVKPLIQFAKQKTTIHPHTPDKASSLVSTGIYRLSRNPMYLALLFLLISYGFYLDNLTTLLPLPFFVLYMNRYQIIPEEEALTKRFGEEYKKYKSEVRRWL